MEELALEFGSENPPSLFLIIYTIIFIHTSFFSGCPGDTPIYSNFQLVIGQHLLPHDHRQLGAGLQAAVRNLARLQDGRPLDLLHLAHADQHEQAEVIEDQVKIMCNNNQKNVSYLLLFSMMVYFLE